MGDFGVGRVKSADTVMLTTFFGTPLYLSPELCENRPYNEKTGDLARHSCRTPLGPAAPFSPPLSVVPSHLRFSWLDLASSRRMPHNVTNTRTHARAHASSDREPLQMFGPSA